MQGCPVKESFRDSNGEKKNCMGIEGAFILYTHYPLY